jgi:hypothetical protein
VTGGSSRCTAAVCICELRRPTHEVENQIVGDASRASLALASSRSMTLRVSDDKARQKGAELRRVEEDTGQLLQFLVGSLDD